MPRHTIATQGFNIVYDDTQVLNLLARAQRAVNESSLYYFLAGPASDYLHHDIAARFASEGDSKSGPWEPLSDATVAIREALGFGPDPINVRTGDMLEFVTKEEKLSVGPSFAELNIPGEPATPELKKKLTTAQQGKVGNERPGFGNTPPRPVLAVDETDLLTILEMLSAHVVYAMFLGA